MERNRLFEREATREIASTLGASIDDLNMLAERRADQYGDEFPDPTRNLELDALEELADCRNYLLWRIESIHRGVHDRIDKVPHLQLALKHVALAFEAVRACDDE